MHWYWWWMMVLAGPLTYGIGGLVAVGLEEVLIRWFKYERGPDSRWLYIISWPVIIPIAIVVIFLEFVYWGIFRKRRLL